MPKAIWQKIMRTHTQQIQTGFENLPYMMVMLEGVLLQAFCQMDLECCLSLTCAASAEHTCFGSFCHVFKW